MLELCFSSKFKKDMKKFEHNKEVKRELNEVLKLLVSESKLPERNRDHLLGGDYKGHRECHVKPDVLLIYWIESSKKVLNLARIGSHSELFN